MKKTIISRHRFQAENLMAVPGDFCPLLTYFRRITLFFIVPNKYKAPLHRHSVGGEKPLYVLYKLKVISNLDALPPLLALAELMGMSIDPRDARQSQFAQSHCATLFQKKNVCIAEHPECFFSIKAIWCSNGIHTNRL